MLNARHLFRCCGIAALLCAGPAMAQVAEVPDSALTPGAVASTDVGKVCGHSGGLTYSKAHRHWRGVAATRAKYGIAPSDHRSYEDDDRVPVSLGGDNMDPRNHWMQPGWGTWNFHVKDRLEDWVHQQVCVVRTMSLGEAQALFLAPDWRVGFCKYIGGAGCSSLGSPQ